MIYNKTIFSKYLSQIKRKNILYQARFIILFFILLTLVILSLLFIILRDILRIELVLNFFLLYI